MGHDLIVKSRERSNGRTRRRIYSSRTHVAEIQFISSEEGSVALLNKEIHLGSKFDHSHEWWKLLQMGVNRLHIRSPAPAGQRLVQSGRKFGESSGVDCATMESYRGDGI